jgi:hypothetical protein
MKQLPPSRPVRYSGASSFVALLGCFVLGIAFAFLLQAKRESKSGPVVLSAEIQKSTIQQKHKRAQIFPSPSIHLETSALDRLRELTKSRQPVDFLEIGLLIRGLKADECKEASMLIRRSSIDERRGLLDVLAKHWAELDPTGAFIAAESEWRDNDWRNRLGFPAGTALVKVDPEGALQRITTARTGDLRIKTAEWVLPSLARIDPNRAAGYLLTNRFLQGHEEIFRNVASAFARVAPHQAMAWVETAAAQSNAQDKNRFRDSLLQMVWSAWADADPVACANEIGENPETKHRENLFAAAAAAWSKKDTFSALKWAESLPDEKSRSAARRSLILDYHELGPEKARQFLSAVDSEPVRAEYAAKIADQIAEEDVQSAFTWARSLPEGIRSKALEPVFKAWTASDPASASRQIAEMPESKERSELMRQAVEQWSQGDARAAFAFVQQLPAGESRDEAIAAAINSIRDDRPQKALEWYGTIVDPRVKAEAATGLMRALIKTDPATALRLAAEIPATAQPDAYKDLVRQWAFDQAKEAGEWINNLPAGKARDAAAEAYVSVIDGSDPARATEWAYSIDDPVSRMESVFNAFGRWIEKDRAGAANWVKQTDIPEGWRPMFDRLLAGKNSRD